MVSINTNLQSLMVQKNLTQSTNILNQAIERMTTGFKINHASDNAANYSIADNMVSQMSSYDVAAENIAMGNDMVSTAQENIALMQTHAERIYDLITQAQNGTYGEASLRAINAEVQSRMAEIDRIYATTEYNGINILEGIELPEWTKTVTENAGLEAGVEAGANLELVYGNFIADPTARDNLDNPINVASLKSASEIDVSSVDGLAEYNSTTMYKITSKADLEKLATLVNVDNADTTGKTFILDADIDLGTVAENVTNWTAIGSSSSIAFNGTFDGNGHKITNLNIYEPTGDYQGLFGYVTDTSTIKNVGVYGNVTGNSRTGSLVGYSNGTISNSYAIGTVNGETGKTGGLAGIANVITNSYAECTVTDEGNYIGGLVGAANGAISNSYATGTVTGGGQYTGGLVGIAQGTISNSYATGTVRANNITFYTGGLVGYAYKAITNSYATGTVTGNGQYTGGLAGYAKETITNCYATGTVTGYNSYTGGLAGYAIKAIRNSYATGNVSGADTTGGLAGYAKESITNCYAAGTVNANYAMYRAGGLVGETEGIISNSYATGNVTGSNTIYIGAIAGSAGGITNSYATGDVAGYDVAGGLVGLLKKTSGTLNIENIASTGSVTATRGLAIGSLFGGIANTSNGNNFSTINITNASALSQNLEMIGFEGKENGTVYESGQMEDWLSNISALEPKSTTLQVGINGDESSRITFDTSVSYDLSALTSKGAQDKGAFEVIQKFINDLSTRATELGAVTNRLDSALESTTTAIENLTSSLSTIRDADVATESSKYIRAQILQQASATLLSTANQSPSIALQLL